jgi:hypothetical protein
MCIDVIGHCWSVIVLTSDVGEKQGGKLDKTYVVCRRLDRDIVYHFQ